jgi:hypothetical protein
MFPGADITLLLREYPVPGNRRIADSWARFVSFMKPVMESMGVLAFMQNSKLKEKAVLAREWHV